MDPLRYTATDSVSSPSSSSSLPIPFGRQMRLHFPFSSSYTPLNHGSFGTFPRVVQDERFRVLRAWEERESISQRFTYPSQLVASRAAVAPLLGVHTDEVVLIPNATTGVNTVLRNLRFEEGDVIVYPETIYGACLKTVQSLEETTPVRGVEIGYTYPIEDDELVERVREGIAKLQGEGKRVRIAVWDTIASRPGVRVPWERVVAACRELGVLSLVDGAHAIGHLDMTETGKVKPDFLVTNCHKWLFNPRGSAVLYVPFENQHLLSTAFPTSHGYLAPGLRAKTATNEYFTNLFYSGATVDVSTYMTIPTALRFRKEFCGGEEAIRAYCAKLAKEGGDMVANSLRTEVLDNRSGSLRAGTAFANVKLPVKVFLTETEERAHDGEGGVPLAEVERMLEWFYAIAAKDFDTYLQTFYYDGAIWTRLSAQVYLEMDDFVWAAGTLKEICVRVRAGEWKNYRRR
ncbi:hypothetical protein OQA88_5388 [Cercophora sp. LCS_1]